jgi:phosphate-selective porin OprO/OprP
MRPIRSLATLALFCTTPAFVPNAAFADEEAAPLVLKGAFGEGMGVEAADGSFGMNLKARAQIRSTVVVPEDEEKDPTADFQARRMRVSLDAHGWDDLVTMRVQLAFATLDQDPVAPTPLRDVFVTFAPLRDLKIRAGQMKVPFGRQRVVSSGNLQMVDRSIVTGELNLDRDVGFQLFSEDVGGLDGLFGYNLGVFGGDGRNRVSGGYGLLYAGRVSVRPVGGDRKDDLDEVDFKQTTPRLQLAVSGAFNQQTDRARSTIGDVFATGPWADYAHAGADTSFKYAGLSLVGEVFLRRALEATNEAEVEGELVTDYARSGYGGYFQAGQLFADQFEVAARVGILHPTSIEESGIKAEKELGGGLSYYAKKHALKVQADTFYLWETWGEGKIQTRLQLQVAP